MPRCFGTWCQDGRREHLLICAQSREVRDPFPSHLCVRVGPAASYAHTPTVCNHGGSVKHLGSDGEHSSVAAVALLKSVFTHMQRCGHTLSDQGKLEAQGPLIPTGNTLHCFSMVANRHPQAGLALKCQFFPPLFIVVFSYLLAISHFEIPFPFEGIWRTLKTRGSLTDAAGSWSVYWHI